MMKSGLKNKKRIIAVLCAGVMLSLAGCGSEDNNNTSAKGKNSTVSNNNSANSDSGSEKKSDNTSGAASFLTVTPDEDGKIIIDTTDISEEAEYINYQSGENIIQLIAVRASDDTVRLTFNTCQSCNPAPRAYFVQNGDTFTCQNCGNSFRTDDLGVERGGCNPAPVEEYEEGDGVIELSAEYLDQFSSAFSYWQGPTA